MKLLKRLVLGFLFIMIAFGTFYLFAHFFKVEDNVGSNATKPTETAFDSSDDDDEPGTSILDNKDNYSLNEHTKLPLTDDATVGTIETDVDSLVDAAMPSMVSVQAKVISTNIWGQQGNSTSAGSGIIMDENDEYYYIVTNNHVISGATSIEVTLPSGNTHEVTLHGSDSAADLAILLLKKTSLDAKDISSIVIATLADSATVEAGDMVIALGNALGYGTSVTVGYISATDREVTSSDGNVMTLIQTDAAINPGNSGGALINMNGEVIGINSSKFEDASVEGMGFSIPVSSALPILNELQSLEAIPEDEKGYLGIYMTQITSDMSEEMNLPIGIYISEIIEHSAADDSDLLVGDIITGVNGIKIKTSAQLQSRITSYRYGTKVTLSVLRRVDGEYQELSIPVTLMPKEGLGEVQ